MSFKQLKTQCWDLNTANQQLNSDFSAAYWEFLIAQINYKEVTFQKAPFKIEFAEYIPLKTLLVEVLTRIAQGEIAVACCQICQQFFNINTEEGIFGDSVHLTHFICQSCSQTLSAWDFYQNYLKL